MAACCWDGREEDDAHKMVRAQCMLIGSLGRASGARPAAPLDEWLRHALFDPTSRFALRLEPAGHMIPASMQMLEELFRKSLKLRHLGQTLAESRIV